MNERIKELAEQSGYSKDFLEIGLPSNMEKFAELIVQECARVVDIWSNEVPCSEGYDKFTVGKLKEHFGVE